MSDTEKHEKFSVLSNSFYINYSHMYVLYYVSFQSQLFNKLIPCFPCPFHQVFHNCQTELFPKLHLPLPLPVWNPVQKHRCQNRNLNMTNENCCHSLWLEKYRAVSTDWLAYLNVSRNFTYHSAQFEFLDYWCPRGYSTTGIFLSSSTMSLCSSQRRASGPPIPLP